jgi:hypothetical protein
MRNVAQLEMMVARVLDILGAKNDSSTVKVMIQNTKQGSYFKAQMFALSWYCCASIV